MENIESEFEGVIVCPVCGKGRFPILHGTSTGGTVTRCSRCRSCITIDFSRMKARQCKPIPQQFLYRLQTI